ncbi:MAG: AMP-binding protein, partial [Candidatus Methylacidiphilales bacterium]
MLITAGNASLTGLSVTLAGPSFSMRSFLQFTLWVAAKSLLWLRYSVTVHGKEKLNGLKGPTLILPNHPGYIDPPLVTSNIWFPLHPRPVVYEDTAKNPVVYPMIVIANALLVPNLEQASSQARQQAEAMIDSVVEGMKKGDNFIIWPSGRLERTGKEILGASRAAADILARVPEANVVLVRTRGVWGSSFSFAQTAKLPNLAACIINGAGYVLANLLFFMPRRSVSHTIEVLDKSKVPGFTREQLNPYLEQWYNADMNGEAEKPTYVPYHFLFGPREFEFPEFKGLGDIPLEKINAKTKAGVLSILEDKVKRPLSDKEKSPESALDQLGLDSLDRMEISLQIEQRFGFRTDQVPSTVGELWVMAQGLADPGSNKPMEAPKAWVDTPMPPMSEKAHVRADTIAEAFVRIALEKPNDIAVADDLAGVLTYERLLTGALLMSKRMAALEGDAVGVMLPAANAADLIFFALQMAGKLPVMLNWTTGPGNLAHAAKVMGIKTVVSSRKFIDRLDMKVEGTEYLFLEDVKGGIGKVEALMALLRVKFMGSSILSALPKQNQDDPAVVLFTSGSEKAPKAVPLSHRNIRSNITNGIAALGLSRGDIFLGFLPAFHSFGLVGNMLICILTGIRLVHHPDPTEAPALVRKSRAYKPTVLLSTPTFVTYILNNAKAGDLDSIRIIVTGAEKAPEALFERCKKLAPNAVISEGYGITECSPVVSVGRPGNVKKGSIGQPLDNINLAVIDGESEEWKELPRGEMGMLLINGDNVFNGYLHHDGPAPFREHDGKKWYITGDLVKIDEDGFIFFCGRLKRFIKAGGEMVSLPALEDPLVAEYPPHDDGPRIAVEGAELPEGRAIVAFTTEKELDLRTANSLLTKAGLRGVMRLDEVRHVDKIPVLGTGKVDYKVLRKEIEKGKAPAG